MMQKMMNKMIQSMSVQEKEDMMLKMMPMMMKDVDLNKLVPGMMEEMGKTISLLGLFNFISKAIKSESIKAKLTEAQKGMKENMPQMMPAMMPVMKEVMPKMMGNVMPAMSGMMKEMTKSGDCFMLDMLDQQEEMKQNMGEIMFNMCPKMANKAIPDEKKKEFVSNMSQTLLLEENNQK